MPAPWGPLGQMAQPWKVLVGSRHRTCCCESFGSSTQPRSAPQPSAFGPRSHASARSFEAMRSAWAPCFDFLWRRRRLRAGACTCRGAANSHRNVPRPRRSFKSSDGTEKWAAISGSPKRASLRVAPWGVTLSLPLGAPPPGSPPLLCGSEPPPPPDGMKPLSCEPGFTQFWREWSR